MRGPGEAQAGTRPSGVPPVIISALRVIGGPAAGSTIVVDRDLVVGREVRPGGVSLSADEELSRHHARFQPLPSGSVMVEDLGSINGTFVNGERITIPRLLAVGDEILVGATTMRLARVADDPRDRAGAPGAPGPPGARRGRRQGRRPRVGRWRRCRPRRRLRAPSPGPAVGVGPGVVGGAPPADRGGRVGAGADRRRRLRGGPGHRSAGRASGAALDEMTAEGTVYVESGASQPGANAIIAYRYRPGGDLQPLDVTSYPTGGAGGFDLTNTGALDADGQIVVSANHKLLFAVNQGSDTVAVFHVLARGALAAVAGSPFPSGGMAPAGLAVSGNRLVVVNKAQDGVRDLASVVPNVTSFLVQPDGSLRPSGSVITAPLGSSPTEALISPDGKVVVVPEEHGPFLSLTLGPDGKLAPAPGSPFSLPDSIFPTGYPSTERWALGLGALPGGGRSSDGVLYGQAVDTAQLVVYRYDDSGRLSFVRAVADPGAYLPCWSLVNAAGTRLYTDNAGNNTMSVFDLSDPLNPRQLQVVTLKNAGNPWDLRMDPTGRYVFVLDPRDREDLVTPGQGNELHTLVVNPDGTLTEPSYSPVPIPVPLNTNPIGLAVVGR